MRLPYFVAFRVLRLITGIHLDPATRILAGFYIGHHGGIWISPLAVIGAHCNVAHEVTIGLAGHNRWSAPVLGDRVWVGPNATISGPVRVGSGAVVAANPPVVSNIPENAVTIGVPARVISYTGSAKLL